MKGLGATADSEGLIISMLDVCFLAVLSSLEFGVQGLGFEV